MSTKGDSKKDLLKALADKDKIISKLINEKNELRKKLDYVLSEEDESALVEEMREGGLI